MPLLFLTACGFSEYAKTMNWEYTRVAVKPESVHFAWVEKIDSAQVIRKFKDEIGLRDGCLYVWTDTVRPMPQPPYIGNPHAIAENAGYAVFVRQADKKMYYTVKY